MSSNACLIFNPIAGQSDPDQDLALIRQILEPALNLQIQLTTAEVDADTLAQAAVAQGYDLIIASGGDGTVSAVAGAVIGSQIPLGVIPRGTANAFANALGLPINIEAACESILKRQTRTVDAADCNGRPMTLLAGIGFEAATVKRANRDYKNRFGMLAYILAGLQELRNLESFETRLETEDKVITLQAAAVTIANVAPPSSVLAQGPSELIADDGLLDVTLVAPGNTFGAIAAAYDLLQSAFRGNMSERADTGYLRTQRIKVITEPPQKVVIDGELMGTTPVEVTCIPGGLTIIVPAPTDEIPPTEKLEGLPNLQIELKEPEENP
jgi:YegS/Rv2252/BmrU family lipid kinase